MFKKRYSPLLVFAIVFRILADIVTAGLPKSHCACSDEQFDEYVIWKVYHFFFVSGFRAKVFRSLTKSFWHGCHNCILCVQINIFFFNFRRKEMREKIFRKSRIAISLRLWAKKILSAFAGMVTAGLSRLRCTCSDEDFHKQVFWKAYQFFLISGNPAKIVQSFQEKISAGWSQLHSTFI